jgi:hypothetical protein
VINERSVGYLTDERITGCKGASFSVLFGFISLLS